MSALTKGQLLNFRARLVIAKKVYIRAGHLSAEYAMGVAGLIVGYNCRISEGVPLGWWNKATTEQRVAMWDNSIAHVDELIARADILAAAKEEAK